MGRVDAPASPDPPDCTGEMQEEVVGDAFEEVAAGPDLGSAMPFPPKQLDLPRLATGTGTDATAWLESACDTDSVRKRRNVLGASAEGAQTWLAAGCESDSVRKRQDLVGVT